MMEDVFIKITWGLCRIAQNLTVVSIIKSHLLRLL